MKKCPSCGRAYSDMVTMCPSCKTSLSGGANGSAPVNQTGYTSPPQTPIYNSTPSVPSKPSYSGQYSTPAQPVQQQYNPAPAQSDETAGFGWIVLSFLLPIVGFILYFKWKAAKPRAAKTVGGAALIGFVLAIVLTQMNLNTASDTPALAAGNPTAYEKIFTDRGILPPLALFNGLDAASYVVVTSDGVVNAMQFGYSGDTVVEIISTVYLSVEGWSDADKTAMDLASRELYAEIEKLSFASVSYNMGYSYYSVAMTLQDLDQTENLREASEVGALTLDNENADSISMSKMEESLFAQGFVKK